MYYWQGDLGALSKFQVWGPNTITTVCSFTLNPYFALSLSLIIPITSLKNKTKKQKVPHLPLKLFTPLQLKSIISQPDAVLKPR